MYFFMGREQYDIEAVRSPTRPSPEILELCIGSESQTTPLPFICVFQSDFWGRPGKSIRNKPSEPASRVTWGEDQSNAGCAVLSDGDYQANGMSHFDGLN